MKSKNNFTLVEILVVIVIMMVLAGILIGGIGYATKKADVSKTISLMTQLETALETFKTDYGYYPTTPITPATPGTSPTVTAVNVSFGMEGTPAQLYLYLPDNTKKFLFVKKGTDNQNLIECGEMGLFKDAWGNAFRYKYPGTRNGEGYELWSCGPDGPSGNVDDYIANWKRN